MQQQRYNPHYRTARIFEFDLHPLERSKGGSESIGATSRRSTPIQYSKARKRRLNPKHRSFFHHRSRIRSLSMDLYQVPIMITGQVYQRSVYPRCPIYPHQPQSRYSIKRPMKLVWKRCCGDGQCKEGYPGPGLAGC